MPFILARVSTPVSKEQEIEIKSRLGRAIKLVPGKSEEYLLFRKLETYFENRIAFKYVMSGLVRDVYRLTIQK